MNLFPGTLFPLDDDGHYSVDHESHYVETWHEMEKLVDAGLTKSIGLSKADTKKRLLLIATMAGILQGRFS